MSREMRHIGVLGLVLALLLAVFSVGHIAREAQGLSDECSENNTVQPVLIYSEEDANRIIITTERSSGTQDENTSQVIVLEIDDARNRDPASGYLFSSLLVLLVLVFSLLLLHILMHHRREGGKHVHKPMHSLLAEKTNPIEDEPVPTPGNSQPLVPEDEPYVLPLALTVLDALYSEPGARTTSMGYPIGHADLQAWDGTGALVMDDTDLEGVIA